MNIIPESHLDLLERPLFAHFATSREDGWPQVNPMWFAWDGTHLKLTGTTVRYKYKNITRDPSFIMSTTSADGSTFRSGTGKPRSRRCRRPPGKRGGALA
jgi:nitroimidazol reductase NimA-like FMN-containing flavoprotein (pyridoxamine 5'-phosphate oxidase superfamily)